MPNRKRNIQMKFYATEEEKKLIDEKMKLLPTQRYGAYLRKVAIADTANIKEFTSPNREYICYRVTLTTSDVLISPKLLDIQLHNIPRPPYERLGFARPLSMIWRLTTEAESCISTPSAALQAGTVAAGWVGHVCEIQWPLDG